jgi:hypothetical protein
MISKITESWSGAEQNKRGRLMTRKKNKKKCESTESVGENRENENVLDRIRI